LVPKAGNPTALPVAVDGANQPLTMSGSATSEGSLSRSGDGHFLLLAGYGTAPGTTSVASTLTSAVNRIVGRIDAAGTADTSTRPTTAFSGNNVRGATSDDGTTLWVSGAGGATGGVWTATFGATGGTQVLASPNSVRVVHVVGGQLYGTANGAPFANVFA